MFEKLKQLLESVGLSHDLLNSKDSATRREARARLAKSYGSYHVVLEFINGDITGTRSIDGVTVTRGTFSSLTAKTFAESAHGVQAWKFISFANLEKVIPTVFAGGITEGDAGGKIGIVKATQTVAGVETDIPFRIVPADGELREIDEIPNDAEEAEETQADASGQTDIFGAATEPKKKAKKSV